MVTHTAQNSKLKFQIKYPKPKPIYLFLFIEHQFFLIGLVHDGPKTDKTKPN